METLFFQTGYLTIREYDSEYDVYRLGYPNEEVKQALSILEMGILTDIEPHYMSDTLYQLRISIENKDINSFMNLLRGLLASIPYNLHLNREAYYHSLFQLLCNLLGFEHQCEVSVSTGRIDFTLITKKYAYLFEFKFNKSAQEALDQIQEKRYHERYLASNKEIVPVGVSFNFDNKQLELDWISQ